MGEKHPLVARFSLLYGHGHFSLTLLASPWTNKTKDGLPVVCAARGIKLFMSLTITNMGGLNGTAQLNTPAQCLSTKGPCCSSRPMGRKEQRPWGYHCCRKTSSFDQIYRLAISKPVLKALCSLIKFVSILAGCRKYFVQWICWYESAGS